MSDLDRNTKKGPIYLAGAANTFPLPKGNMGMEGEETAGDSAELPSLHNSSVCPQGDDYEKETSRKRKKAALVPSLRKGPLVSFLPSCLFAGAFLSYTQNQ